MATKTPQTDAIQRATMTGNQILAGRILAGANQATSKGVRGWS
jgi:hypothetical protein